MPTRSTAVAVALALVTIAGCARTPAPGAPRTLTGAWRADVQFESGAFQPVKDLSFLYVFNDGGTMTESSNYDGLPPVPPAYGEWRATGGGGYEAKYSFFTTKPPADVASIPTGGGWMPAGHGVLTESIRLAPDGRTYDSTIEMVLYDSAGKPAAGGGRALAHAVRAGF